MVTKMVTKHGDLVNWYKFQ